MIWYIASACALSTIINIFFIWYVVSLLRKLVFVSDNIGNFLGILNEYNDHLQGLHEMEMFYGDETLKGLIDHTEFITDEIKNFESVYTLVGYEEEQEQDESAETEATSEEEN
jgi:hypothetical protein|tara:strand:+ start:5458 stop:5796 length:339 start_codon:yes stop_codon:yes gene_type:complete